MHKDNISPKTINEKTFTSQPTLKIKIYSKSIKQLFPRTRNGQRFHFTREHRN